MFCFEGILQLSINIFPMLFIMIYRRTWNMTDSMGPGELVSHMQNLPYTYDTYLICMGLEQSISSVIAKCPSYSGPSYPSSPVLHILLDIFVFVYLV